MDLDAIFKNKASPEQKIDLPIFAEAGIRFFMKRDDLLHKGLSGNKWRKLKYNLYYLRESNFEGIITPGGAFSNHLHAVAAAGQIFNFKTIGIVRGEEPGVLSNTLKACIEMGMKLIFISRSDYREKENSLAIKKVISENPSFYYIPEGGENELARKGCAEIPLECSEFDYLCLPCGTGTTLSGILDAPGINARIIGFSVLKGAGQTIHENIQKGKSDHQKSLYTLNTDYHFGGYAKYNAELLDFIRDFEVHTKVLLEQVYTGKMMFGIFDLIKKGYFKRGSKIIALHTGGLQGRLPSLDILNG